MEESLWMIHARPGLGKTWFCMGVAHAVATGGTFLKWKADEARNVLYVDGEMSRREMFDRLNVIFSTSPLPTEKRFKLLCGSRRAGGKSQTYAPKKDKTLSRETCKGWPWWSSITLAACGARARRTKPSLGPKHNSGSINYAPVASPFLTCITAAKTERNGAPQNESKPATEYSA